MKKMMKRIGAVLMAIAMMAALAVTAWAATPSASDKGTITVTNLDANATVKAYKIVKANYDANKGFVGYETVVKLKDTGADTYTTPSIADIEAPKVAELNVLQGFIGKASTYQDDIGAGGLTAINPTTTANGTATFSNMDVGEYMIIVTSSDTDYIYNPMVGSVYYVGSDNTVSDPNSISATGEWTIKGDTVFAKSNKEDISKTIVDNSRENPAGTKGDDHAIGDDVMFMIQTTIPSYSTDYKFPFFNITDSVSKGLDINTSSIKVYVDANSDNLVDASGKVKSATDIASYELAASANTYTLTPTQRTGSDPATYDAFKIAFTQTYLQEVGQRAKTGGAAGETEDFYVNGGKTVVVTYTAHINENATVNMEANTNTAKIQYQNNPDSEDDKNPAEKESKTYHYTFEIDGAINGTETEGGIKTWKTHELIKLNENGDVGVTNEQHFSATLEETTVTNPLAGAVFRLTRTDDAKGDPAEVYYAMTDANGYFSSYTAATTGANAMTADQKTAADGNLTNEITAAKIKGFTGLDAGTYELEEVIAPTGYSRDASKHNVVITTIYNTDGTLKNYTITIDGTATSSYTASYDATDKKITKIELGDISNPVDPDMSGYTDAATTTFIKNTKLANLPSTGGIGTYVFTVAGVAIMAIAAGLLIVRHKKKAE